MPNGENSTRKQLAIPLFTALAAGAATLLTPSAPAQASQGCETTHLTIVTESGNRSSPQGQAIQRVAELARDYSEGCLELETFYQDQLGGPLELADQLSLGNIDILLGWPSSSFDARLSALHLPYLALNWEDAADTYGSDGWLSDLVRPIFAENDLRYMGPFPEGFGGVATRGDYATTIEGASSIKVRSAPVFPLPQAVRALGYQAVPIDWSETYTSIQTGVVDGDSSNIIYWDYTYFRDLLDYYVHTRHNFSFFAFLMSQRSWEGLGDNNQQAIARAIATVSEEQFEGARAEDQKWIRRSQEAGIEYIEPSAEEMANLVENVRAEVWANAEDSIGEELMQAIRDNASTPDP